MASLLSTNNFGCRNDSEALLRALFGEQGGFEKLPDLGTVSCRRDLLGMDPDDMGSSMVRGDRPDSRKFFIIRAKNSIGFPVCQIFSELRTERDGAWHWAVLGGGNWGIIPMKSGEQLTATSRACQQLSTLIKTGSCDAGNCHWTLE